MLHKTDDEMANPAAISNEMQAIVRRAAEPWRPGDSVKAGIDRAARTTGLTFRRIRTLWYRQTEAISAVEADTLRAWNRRWLATQKDRLRASLAQLEIEWERMGGDA